MPYRNIFFEKNQPFHIIAKAIEKRDIFKEEEDCYRFLFQLQAANIGSPAPNLWKKDIVKAAQALLAGEEIPSKFIIKEHEPFVNFLDFSLVVTHYHLYLVPNIENGVPLFMKRLNGGFAKYFNLKYNREGALFGSRYKSIPVKTRFQSDAVSRYVSIINPLDVYQPAWRENGLRSLKDALYFLENYDFSSFPDRAGKRRSKILAPQHILEAYCSSSVLSTDEYFQFVNDFLSQKLSSFSHLFLE